MLLHTPYRRAGVLSFIFALLRVALVVIAAAAGVPVAAEALPTSILPIVVDASCNGAAAGEGSAESPFPRA